MDLLAIYREVVPEYSHLETVEEMETAITNALEVIWERFISNLIQECPSKFIEDLRLPETLALGSVVPMDIVLSEEAITTYRLPYELPQFMLARVALHWTLSQDEVDVNTFLDFLRLLNNRHIELSPDALYTMTKDHDYVARQLQRVTTRSDIFAALGKTVKSSLRIIEVAKDEDIEYVRDVAKLYHKEVSGDTLVIRNRDEWNYDKTDDMYAKFKLAIDSLTETSPVHLTYLDTPNITDITITNVPAVLEVLPNVYDLRFVHVKDHGYYWDCPLDNIMVHGNDEELSALSERTTQNVESERRRPRNNRDLPDELLDEDTRFLIRIEKSTQGKSLETRMAFSIPWFIKSIVITKEEATKETLDKLLDLGFVIITIQVGE